MNTIQAWEFVQRCDRLIRWALFRRTPKRITMFAFGSALDAVQELRIKLFAVAMNKPDVIQRYKASTIVAWNTRWLIAKRIELRKKQDSMIRDDSDAAPDFDDTELSELADVFKKLLKSLTYREREIIKLRYGLGGDGYAYNLSETAAVFRITKERIRQIESKALRKLQHPTRRQSLNDFGWRFVRFCKTCEVSRKLDYDDEDHCKVCNSRLGAHRRIPIETN